MTRRTIRSIRDSLLLHIYGSSQYFVSRSGKAISLAVEGRGIREGIWSILTRGYETWGADILEGRQGGSRSFKPCRNYPLSGDVGSLVVSVSTELDEVSAERFFRAPRPRPLVPAVEMHYSGLLPSPESEPVMGEAAEA